MKMSSVPTRSVHLLGDDRLRDGAVEARPSRAVARKWLPVLLIGLLLPLLLLEPPELEISFVLPHGIEQTLGVPPVEASGSPHSAILEDLHRGRAGVRLVRPWTRVLVRPLRTALLPPRAAVGLASVRAGARPAIAALRPGVARLAPVSLTPVGTAIPRPAVGTASIRASVAGLRLRGRNLPEQHLEVVPRGLVGGFITRAFR
jgi:hypothetical protein